MRCNVGHLIRAIILVGFAAFFIKLHYTGDIEKFINPKYEVTSKIAAGTFILLFMIQLTRVWAVKNKSHGSCSAGCDHQHHTGSFVNRVVSHAIIMFPVITGFLIAPVTLDASIAAKKSTIMTPGNETENQTGESDDAGVQHQTPVVNDNYFSKEEYDSAMEDFKNADVIQMDEEMYGAYHEAIDMDPKKFIGRKIKMNGFVYREDDFSPSQLVLARFYMIHCVADTSVVGFLTEFEEANEFTEDTWLEIEGTLDVTRYNGAEFPVIKAEAWHVIEEPEEPYTYPPLIQLVGSDE